jgi:hypothetical protein
MSARTTDDSPTRRPLLPDHTFNFARVGSDNDGVVGRACHGSTMNTRHQLKGIELRYALTMYLLQHGPTTVDELIKALEWQGFEIGGRASKHVSDALRWERRRGRVRRLARGLYAPGYVPRGTEYRIYNRVMELRAAAKPLWFRGVRL